MKDAIIMSDRLFKGDVYTSIHIENYTLNVEIQNLDLKKLLEIFQMFQKKQNLILI